jgi:hypothetical protein
MPESASVNARSSSAQDRLVCDELPHTPPHFVMLIPDFAQQDTSGKPNVRCSLARVGADCADEQTRKTILK